MRTIVLTAILILASLNVFTQGFKAGLTGGLNVTQVDGDNCLGYHKVGVHGGIYSKYYFDEQLSLTAKLRYIPKGSYHNDDKTHYYFKIYLNYIEVPVSISYELFTNLELNAGLSFGWLFKYRVEDPNGDVANDRLAYKNIDINGIGGLSYYLSDHISVSLEYAYSLMPINTLRKPQYNNLITGSLNYEF